MGTAGETTRAAMRSARLVRAGWWAIRTVACLAAAVSAYLAWASWSTGGEALGCGGSGVGCRHVLGSRWGYWFGLPVGLPAAAVYGLLVATTFPAASIQPRLRHQTAHWLVLALALAAGLSALWFVAVLFALGESCPWCLAVHACGVSVAGLALAIVPFDGKAAATSIVLVAVLITGQLTFVPADYRVEKVAARLPLGERPLPQETSPRHRLALLGGKLTIDPAEHPLLGDPDAEHSIVELSDYTCRRCRSLSANLELARRRYGGRLAVVVLPVPMNGDCNPFVKETSIENLGACRYALAALAVWRADPREFPAFHRWLMAGDEPPLMEEVERKAAEAVGLERFQSERAGKAVRDELNFAARVYDLSGRGTVPKLLIGNDFVFSGGSGQAEQLFRVLERLTGLEPQP